MQFMIRSSHTESNSIGTLVPTSYKYTLRLKRHQLQAPDNPVVGRVTMDDFP